MSLIYGDDFEDNLVIPNSYCFTELFSGCSSLTSSPKLPATTLTEQCYSLMFYNCDSLTTAPELPAMTVGVSSYAYMFQGCTALTKTPALPAMTLSNSCYGGMFYGCTSLTVARNLPATTLAERCYEGMFEECSSLSAMPLISATTLASYCCSEMFKLCESLVKVYKLPATTLSEGCYSAMFYGCTSLKESPRLPAETLSPYCYEQMFYECSSLNQITMLARNISASYCLADWVDGVSSSGAFVKNEYTDTLPRGTSGIPKNWIIYNDGDYIFKYFTIRVLTNNSTVVFNNTDPYSILEYSVNSESNWERGTRIGSLSMGDTVSFRGNLVPPSENEGIGHISSGFSYDVCGNIMSLLYGDDFEEDNDGLNYPYIFANLFSNTGIKDASRLILPEDTLTEGCYLGMFTGSTLMNPPMLPATILADWCYSYMFNDCVYLTDAPQLPATTLSESCYYGMFQDCVVLMTSPELIATKLLTNCYSGMFHGCEQLNHITMLATDISASGCLNNWVYNVADEGTFVKHPDMTSLSSGVHGIPSGWTTLDYEGGNSDVNLIAFYTTETGVGASKKYYAEEGMTWDEFINSEYNNDSFVKSSGYVYDSSGRLILYSVNGDDIHVSDVIIEDYVYQRSPYYGGAS
jgi:hypothetical protein